MEFGVGEFPDVLFEITDKIGNCSPTKAGPNFGSAGLQRDQTVGK
jgi:hypothetical protein